MIKVRICLALAGMVVLSACSPRASVPNGTHVLDEQVTLVRAAGARVDVATREFAADEDTIVVAVVDENLTDVKLRVAATGVDELPAPVEVENNLSGAGVELAMLAVPEGALVQFTLTGRQDSKLPGAVRLRVRRYAAGAQDGELARTIASFRAWTDATNSAFRADAARTTGVPRMQAAIDGLVAARDEAALLAQARLIKARMLHFFKIDWRESRAEARRAAAAFAKLPAADPLGEARGRYLEALALSKMSFDLQATNPTAEEARRTARATLEALAAPASPFGPIERARVLTSLGHLDVAVARAPDAQRHYEQARALYVAQGRVAGEREMRYWLASLLVAQGRFADGAQSFMAMIHELDLLSDPEMRVDAYLSTARALSLSGRSDEGADLMLMALPLARDYQLRELEARALQNLGYIYQNRGDLQQAADFHSQALIAARDSKDMDAYVSALAAAAAGARNDGDLKRAIALHEEAVRKAAEPIMQVRTRLGLAYDYYKGEDLPKAMALCRDALAIDLHDPMGHAYTDVKFSLAIFIAEYTGSKPADLDEADRLIAAGLATSSKLRDDFRIIYAARAQAEVDVRRGNFAQARASFEKTLALARAYRERSTSTEARSSMMSDEERAFRGYLDIVLADVTKRPPGVLAPATADQLAGLRRLEQARQRSFGALRVGKLNAESGARVDKLLDEMARKGLRISALADATDPAQARELRDLQADMTRLHAELDQVRATAAARNARLPEKEDARAWRPLGAHAVQVSYALGQEHAFVLVRSASGTRVTMLAPTPRQLEQQLADLAKIDTRRAPDTLERSLDAVSAVLMPAGLLPANTSEVAIVAEGRIASVPFPALRSPLDPQRRLVETHDISMVTSLFAGDEPPRPRQARPFRFVALASGSGTYRAATANPAPRLQAATKEIRVAADLFTAQDSTAKVRLFTGTDGTAAALRDIWASGADVVHFATHALADLRQPVASLLVLPATDDAGKSTYLTAGQVQAWRGDTELVFLSACESAVGPPQFAAGMPGLQLAFLRAGARGVIATLAPIEDVLAQKFSADFYERYTGGASAERALGETQRAWLAAAPGASEAEKLRRRITALSHAYYAN